MSRTDHPDWRVKECFPPAQRRHHTNTHTKANMEETYHPVRGEKYVQVRHPQACHKQRLGSGFDYNTIDVDTFVREPTKEVQR